MRLPVLLSQQYTRGLGATVPELREALHEYSKLEKLSSAASTHRVLRKRWKA